MITLPKREEILIADHDERIIIMPRRTLFEHTNKTAGILLLYNW
jgi:hypothetical protein